MGESNNLDCKCFKNKVEQKISETKFDFEGPKNCGGTLKYEVG